VQQQPSVSPELQKTILAERNVSYVRSLVIVLNTFGYLLMDKEGTIPWLAYGVIIFVWPYGAYVLLAQPYKRYPVLMASYFTLISDIIFTLVWLTATGGFESPYYVLWYVSIVATSFRFRLRHTVFSGIAYSLSYTFLLIYLGEFWGHEQIIVLRCGFIFIMGYLGFFITNETYQQLLQRNAVEAIAEKLKNSQKALHESNKELTQTLEELKSAEEHLVRLNTELESRVSLRTSELNESQERYRFMADAIPQLVWTAKPDGRIDYFNRKWYEYKGMNAEGKEDFEWIEYVHPDDLGNLLYLWKDSLSTGKPFGAEFRIRRADGIYRWFMGRGEAMKDTSGKILKWFGTCTDIQDQKEVVQYLNEARSELLAKNEELHKINIDLDNFIYTASHDLKSPIVNIQGLLNALKKRMENPRSDQIQLFSMMESSISKFKKTISDLTEITKVLKENEADRETVSFREMVEDVKSDIYSMLKESSSEIIEEYEVETINYPRKDLRSILYNLISNAVKYRKPDVPSKILIRTFTRDGNIMLSVKDNGLGIPADQLPKLFTMFKRLHAHVEGSGIGLYIIKRIIENHRGKIEIKSVEGEGTEFVALLSSDNLRI
jgi:PAS domain S-box-containing protein